MGWITGRHAIQAAISGSPGGTRYLRRKDPRGEDLAALAIAQGVPVRYVSADKLKRLAGPGARGYALEVRETSDGANPDEHGRSVDLERWLDRNTPVQPSPILALDHITDPHNLGAILRSVHWFGAPLVIIPARRSATGGDVVARASSGAVSHVDIAFVTNLRAALERCRDAGYWIYAAEADGIAVETVQLNVPAVLVLGSEGAGISPGITKAIDQTVRISDHRTESSDVDSLNVSVSAGILLYEFRRGNLAET